MNQCVIGIDIGTSGTKTIAVDQDGKILASALASYPLYTPKPGWNEQAPEDWWQAAAETLKKVTSRLEHTEIVGPARCTAWWRWMKTVPWCAARFCGTISAPQRSARRSPALPAGFRGCFP